MIWYSMVWGVLIPNTILGHILEVYDSIAMSWLLP